MVATTEILYAVIMDKCFVSIMIKAFADKKIALVIAYTSFLSPITPNENTTSKPKVTLILSPWHLKYQSKYLLITCRNHSLPNAVKSNRKMHKHHCMTEFIPYMP